MLDERRLDRVELAVRLQPFDRGDRLHVLQRGRVMQESTRARRHGRWQAPHSPRSHPFFRAGQV